MKLNGKTAIVTGGNTGLGKNIAKELGKAGVNVVINYAFGSAEDIVSEIKSSGGEAIAIKADVSNIAEVNSMVNEAVKEYGSIHFLINNAGTTCKVPFENIEELTDVDWDNIFAVNLKGAFNCVQSVVPVMKKNSGCSIINIGSTAGITGIGSSIPYAVSKGAIHCLTKSLANILAPDIRVNCLSPGPMETEWWSGREEYIAKVSASLPMKRLVQPQEVTDTILALLQIEAFTGQIVSPNCGRII
jgi:3-oxoacyl-[acyl-carrier protein] reductase